MSKAVNLAGMFATALRWDAAVGAVAEVFFQNRRRGSLAGFAAEDKAWVLVESMRKDLWERAQTAWGRLTGRSPLGFPYSVDFVAAAYNALSRVAPAALKAWLKTTFPDETAQE